MIWMKKRREADRRLENIEALLKLALTLLEERAQERTQQDDKWLQSGIDSILSYQAGKGRKED